MFSSAIPWFLFVAFFALQQLPILWLTFKILLSPAAPPNSYSSSLLNVVSRLSSTSTTSHTPTRPLQQSTFIPRICLAFAILMELSLTFPPSIWSLFIHQVSSPSQFLEHRLRGTSIDCMGPFVNVSWSNVLQFAFPCHLVLIFFFIRWEFHCAKNRLVLNTVSEVQDTFGF